MKKEQSKQAVKEGKMSIKELHKKLGFGTIPADYDDNQSTLSIDKRLEEELIANDLVWRFINFKEYKKKGFHSSKWVPYQRTSTPQNGALYTQDPNGYTVKQDLILAVKPNSYNDAHKKYLKSKVDRQGNPQKIKAQEMKESLKESGLSGKITVGYDENK